MYSNPPLKVVGLVCMYCRNSKNIRSVVTLLPVMFAIVEVFLLSPKKDKDEKREDFSFQVCSG